MARNEFWLFLIFCCAVFVSLILTQQAVWLNHDVASHYIFSKTMLHGAEPYRDFIDMNFPMIWYLGLIPAWLSEKLSLTDPTIVYFWIAIMFCVGFFTFTFILTHYLKSSDDHPVLLTLVLVLYTITYPFIFHFGQREHLMIIFFLPYLAICVLRVSKIKISISIITATTMLASIGLLLKPHFIVLFLLCETYCYLIMKRIDHATKTITAAFGIFLFLFVISMAKFTPGIIEIMKIALTNYSQYSFITIIPLVFSKWTIISTFLVLLGVRFNQRNKLAELFCLCSWGFFIISVLQRQGYPYHIVPTKALGICSSVISLWMIAKPTVELFVIINRFSPFIITFLLLGVLGFNTFNLIDSLKQNLYYTKVLPGIYSILDQYARKGTVYNLTTQLTGCYPVVLFTDTLPTNPFNCLWFLRGFYDPMNAGAGKKFPYHSLKAMSILEREFFKKVVTSLIKTKPDIIVTTRGPDQVYFPEGSRFDFFEYYDQDMRFNQFIKNYKCIAIFEKIVLYKRTIVL